MRHGYCDRAISVAVSVEAGPQPVCSAPIASRALAARPIVVASVHPSSWSGRSGPLHAKTRTWDAKRRSAISSPVRSCETAVSHGASFARRLGLGQAACARARRSAHLPPESAVDCVPDGVPAERSALPRQRHEGGGIQLRGDVSSATRSGAPRARGVACERRRPGRRHRQCARLTRQPTGNGFDHASEPSRPTTSTRPHFSNSGGSNRAATIDPSSARSTTDPRQCISSGCAFHTTAVPAARAKGD